MASYVEVIFDLGGVTFELAAHPKACVVVPNAASVIGRDEGVTRGLNLTPGNRNWLVGNLVRADADDAATLRVDHRRLLEHRRGPYAVRRQGGDGSDKRAALAQHAKSLGRGRALDVEGLAVLHGVT